MLYVSEYENRTPLKLVTILIPTVLGFVLISVIVAAIIQAKKRHAGKTEGKINKNKLYDLSI